jgi:hypothetical protein
MGMNDRKIIQISVGLVSEGDSYIVALCDDSTVWRIWNNRDWELVKPIPQDRPSNIDAAKELQKLIEAENAR